MLFQCIFCSAQYSDDIEYCSCGGDVVPVNPRPEPRYSAPPPPASEGGYRVERPPVNRRKEVVRGILGTGKRVRL